MSKQYPLAVFPESPYNGTVPSDVSCKRCVPRMSAGKMVAVALDVVQFLAEDDRNKARTRRLLAVRPNVRVRLLYRRREFPSSGPYRSVARE